MSLTPKHFISEPILPSFAEAPMLEKAPPCPDAFEWRGELWRVGELLEFGYTPRYDQTDS